MIPNCLGMLRSGQVKVAENAGTKGGSHWHVYSKCITFKTKGYGECRNLGVAMQGGTEGV